MQFEFISRKNNGGYNDGDPPLPIPNREVKPISADDTAIPSGKVGSRQLCETFRRNSEGLFFCAQMLLLWKLILKKSFTLAATVWQHGCQEYEIYRLSEKRYLSAGGKL